jgi:predicted short-subunit dehydrogenase-like oxidoreductase (DUF2520 family)
LALQRAGRPPLGLWSRSARTAGRARALTGLPCFEGALPEAAGEARLLILAVADPAIASLAGALLDGGLLRSAEVVLHCAGSRPAAEALAGLGPPLARGTFHPLLAIADPAAAAARLAGATIVLEGDPPACLAGDRLARCVGARALELRAEGLLLYHSAAVLASNHAVALWAAALELLERAGMGRGDALSALVPLLGSTVENLANLGLPAALTGPVRRADWERVAAELDALAQAAPELLPLFREATSLAVALARGLGEPELEPGLQRIEERLALFSPALRRSGGTRHPGA